jgi:hypothetical protein
LCFPHFDSPSVLAAMLDDEMGGRFVITPYDDSRAKQLYFPETNVLVTRFLVGSGVAEVSEYMPVGRAAEQCGRRGVVRHVRGIRGCVRLRMRCVPAVDFARVPHRVEAAEGGVWFKSAVVVSRWDQTCRSPSTAGQRSPTSVWTRARSRRSSSGSRIRAAVICDRRGPRQLSTSLHPSGPHQRRHQSRPRPRRRAMTICTYCRPARARSDRSRRDHVGAGEGLMFVVAPQQRLRQLIIRRSAVRATRAARPVPRSGHAVPTAPPAAVLTKDFLDAKSRTAASRSRRRQHVEPARQAVRP